MPRFLHTIYARPAARATPRSPVTPNEIASRFGTDQDNPIWQRHGAVANFIDELEAKSSAVYLIADKTDSAWTRFCLQHADEILLLAEANQSPALSDVEASLLDAKAPLSIARQTLVLLHKIDTKSPMGTARWLDVRPGVRHFHIRPELPRDMRRLSRIISGRAVGAVLAGGGAKGFAHVGVIKALEETGIEVDFVGGTSIGAIMGTCLALDLDAEKVSTAVHKAFLLHPKGNITGDYNFLPLVSLIKGRRTHGAMVQAVRDAADADIDMEDTWKTFFVIASNFSTGNEAVLSKGSLTRNVIASYAIPGALPPVFIDGQMMFDGGTFNNFPVDVMAQIGAGQIIGVDLSTDHGRVFNIERVPSTFALLRDKLRPRSKQRYRLPTMPETMLNSSFISSISKQKAMRKFADLLFQPRISRVGMLEWKRYSDIVAADYIHAKEVLGGMTEDHLNKFRRRAPVRSANEHPRSKNPAAVLFVAINLLALLVALLRLDRQRCDGTRFQPLQRDGLAGFFAIPVGIVVDALDRSIDLRNEFALAITRAKFDGAVGFGGCTVSEVRMIDVLFLKLLKRGFRFAKDLFLPVEELAAEILPLPLVHERLFFGRPVVFQLFQGRSISTCKAGTELSGPRRSLYSGVP